MKIACPVIGGVLCLVSTFHTLIRMWRLHSGETVARVEGHFSNSANSIKSSDDERPVLSGLGGQDEPIPARRPCRRVSNFPQSGLEPLNGCDGCATTSIYARELNGLYNDGRPSSSKLLSLITNETYVRSAWTGGGGEPRLS